MEVAVGQVWRELKSGHRDRFVRIERIDPTGQRCVVVRTVVRDRLCAWPWIQSPRSKLSRCDIDRFNGQSGGYEFVEAIEPRDVK